MAIIALAGTAIGSLGGILAANRLTTYRIEQLEKKVEKHNNLVERTYDLERRESLLEARLTEHEKLFAERLNTANHRIEDLEREG